jgi:hypothetical protein
MPRRILTAVIPAEDAQVGVRCGGDAGGGGNTPPVRPGAVVRDLLLAVRADEAGHAHVNHTLAALEPADFVHIYDCGADYRREQLIDLFGENAGISFSPCGEALFVGVSDLTYGSLVEYHRVQPSRRRLPRL